MLLGIMMFVFIVVFGLIGAVVRIMVFRQAMAQRQYEATFRDIERQLPPAGQVPSQDWINQVAALASQHSRMSELQRAGSEARKAQMMGLAARAGISIKL